jgi:hypothetical protein
MLRTLTLSATLGALILAASCAEEPKKEEAAKPAPAAAAEPAAAPKEQGPYYELTKDEVTSHSDWTSMNVTFKGAKIGDKKVAPSLGKGEKTDPVGTEHYRTVFEKSSFAIYTYKMTGELQKIEIFNRMADQIADPKFKKLLSSGDLAYMRQAFGMEEKMEMNFDTTAMEYLYDAKGFRFAQYNLGGVKVNSIIFSKIKK